MTTLNHAPRALIIDDDSAMRRLITLAMAREGFRCDVAWDGEQAERQLAETRYDVVVTDLQMPNRNGHAVAVDVLQRRERPLVIVLTAVTEPRLAKDLLARGVDDIVFKPVDITAFAAKVRSQVNQRQGASTPDAATVTHAGA